MLLSQDEPSGSSSYLQDDVPGVPISSGVTEYTSLKRACHDFSHHYYQVESTQIT